MSDEAPAYYGAAHPFVFDYDVPPPGVPVYCNVFAGPFWRPQTYGAPRQNPALVDAFARELAAVRGVSRIARLKITVKSGARLPLMRTLSEPV